MGIIEDKRGFAITGMLILLVLAVLGALAFFISSTIRWYLIGIGLLVAMVYIISSIKDDKIKILSTVVLLAGALFFILGSGYLQTAWGTSTYLSIDNVQIDGEDLIRIYTSAGNGAEELIIDFSENELNEYLEDKGYKATEGITGRVEFLMQSKSFNLIKDTDKTFYGINYVEKSTGTLCSKSNCENSIPFNSALTYYGRTTGFFGDCLCNYVYPVGYDSYFTGTSDKDFAVQFTIGDDSAILNSDDTSINVGSARVQWVGDLTSLNEVNAPNYNSQFNVGQYLYLIPSDAYSRQLNLFQDYEICMTGLANQILTRDWWTATIFEGRSRSELDNCQSTYNNAMNNYVLTDKTSDYEVNEQRYVKDTFFSGNKFVVNLQIPESYPTFIITIDADSVGIVKLEGEPKIINCIDDFEIKSGEPYSEVIDVKNIGDSDGMFNGRVSCNGKVHGNVNSIFIKAGETESTLVTFSGTNTEEGIDYSNCEIIIEDQQSDESDSCNVEVGIEYHSGLVCTPNKIECLSNKILRTCNNDGTNFEDETCNENCIYIEEIAQCSFIEGEEGDIIQPSNNKTCKWYEDAYTSKQKDWGFLYWRAIIQKPIITTIEGCRIASWIYLVSGSIIILTLGIITIRTFKPKKKMKGGKKK